MSKDYYVDVIMGEWVHNDKKSTKQNLVYERTAKAKLHKDMAMDYIDPDDFKEYKVHGDVILTEKKLLNIKTGGSSFFRGLKLTDTTIKETKIK